MGSAPRRTQLWRTGGHRHAVQNPSLEAEPARRRDALSVGSVAVGSGAERGHWSHVKCLAPWYRVCEKKGKKNKGDPSQKHFKKPELDQVV